MRRAVAPDGRLVVKIGSSSLVRPDGTLNEAAAERIAGEVAGAWLSGHPTVLVTSGAVASGLLAVGLTSRPSDIPDMQAAAAVGQVRLMHRYAEAFSRHGLVVGQVLLTRDVLAERDQYLHARQTMDRMLAKGIVPIVNGNDTVGVDETRLSDNDRLAAIVSHLVGASLLVIFTDTDGIFSSDPRHGEAEFLAAVDHADERLDSLSGSGPLGSGGVATKVKAARIAAWSRIPTVVARARNSLGAIVDGEEVGTWVEPRSHPLPARKLWIAFCQRSAGAVQVDDGAADALITGGRSLLPVGITSVRGQFAAGQTVEVTTSANRLVGRGLSRMDSEELTRLAGRQGGREAIHRDDLVVLVDA